MKKMCVFGVVFLLPACAAAAGSAQDSMKAAMDAQLTTHGYGKLCIDGPDGGPKFTVDADEPVGVKAKAKELQALGFIRVVSTAPNPIDGDAQTVYEITALGRRDFSTYEKLGWSGQFNGWCFAEYRVGRIVSNTTPADFMGHRVTTVTYYPHIISVVNWATTTPAKAVPEVRALRSFEAQTRTQTLVQTSDGWQGTSSQ